MKSFGIATLALLFITSATAGPLGERLKALWPDYTVETIESTPVPNLLSVKFKEVGDVAYITQDGNYLIEGQILDLKGRQPRNLQDLMLAGKRAQLLGQPTVKEITIKFPATRLTHHRVFVFVDTDCGFCRKFLEEMPELQEAGIEVNFLPFPREGLNSHAGKVMSRIWCQPHAAGLLRQVMVEGDAALGHQMTCPDEASTISRGMNLASQLQVIGTPAIFSEDGHLLGGYLPATELLKLLEH